MNACKTAIANSHLLSCRLQGVDSSNRPAAEVVRQYGRPDALLYCDPRLPLGMCVRDGRGRPFRVAGVLNECGGRVQVSGYPSPLCDDIYRHLNQVSLAVANHASQKAVEQKNE